MLRSWFDTGGEFNAANLVLLSTWGLWILALVAVLITAVLYLSWHNTAELPIRRRLWLLGLRSAAVLVLGVLFLQPAVRLEHVTRVRNHVIMLVDDSGSMGLPGASADTRTSTVKTLFQRAEATIATWRETHQVDLYRLTDHARPIGDVSELRSEGDATRILSSLEDIAARFEPDDLAAVVVISDGADNGALGDAVGPGTTDVPAANAVARRLGVPIHTVFTGPKKAPADIAITKVAYDDFAFVRNAVSIEADVRVTGFADLVLPVTLRQDDQILGTRMLQTEKGRSDYRFEFEFVPDKTGKSVFTLEVGQGPLEQILVNNQRQFVIRVIRDKIRVLQVVGRPSWDERFLRKLLKKNPNVDLISFFILRTSASIDVAQRDELSLIPFPTQELFEEQLGSFDLIIFQNFTYRGYHMRHYLPLIRDYVRNGGGFVMIGGDQSFASGGFTGTPVAEFLPVKIPHDHTDLLQEGRFNPTLTEAGLRHPITALSVIPEENKAHWAALPELSGINRVTGLQNGATVLLRHPTRMVGGELAPVVSVADFYDGRVLAVTTDTTWQWSFQPADTGGDSRHYFKFWGNAIRWLIRDPALKPVRIEADRDRYPLGTETTLMTRVVGSDYAPAADVEVTVIIEQQGTDAVISETSGQTDENGEYVLRLTVPSAGAYRARVSAQLRGGAVDDIDVFVVRPDPVELRQTHARSDTLKVLAEAGGGELRMLKEGLADLERVEPRVVKVNRRRDVPIWASGWLLLLGILLPSAEWYLRRRWGLQ